MRPYRAVKRAGLWCLIDTRAGLPLCFAFDLADLWRQAKICLEPIATRWKL